MSIVVGVDGSASALGAIRTATVEAVLRRTELRIVHAFIWPLMHVPLGPSPIGPESGGLRHEAERILAEAVLTAAETDASVKTETVLVTGAAPTVLIAEAVGADMVVLGDRGLGVVGDLLIGSVALRVIEHSAVPVLVVKGHTDPDGPVIVGFDGSTGAYRALHQAFGECRLHGSPLVAAHVRGEFAAFDAMPSAVYERDPALGPDERPFTRVFDTARRRHPGVRVTDEVLVGDVGETLVARTSGAHMIVLGSHGRGGFPGLPIGSVSRYVLRHAHCPVLVAPIIRAGERNRVGRP